MVWVGEEYVVEPNGWVDERYVDPAFSLLPVQPPEVNPLSLPRPKNYLTPVGYKLERILQDMQYIQMNRELLPNPKLIGCRFKFLHDGNIMQCSMESDWHNA